VRGVTHVFVHHGDSDKMTSAMPRMAQYDVIVAAGQAAVDRYATRGIDLPPSKFKILGRPQTEGIRTVTRPISVIAKPVVLYAPTWHGVRDELDYCSLPVGAQIVTALLDRGATVVFRPHPAGRNMPEHSEPIAAINALLAADAKATGRKHRWGRAADAPSIAQLTNQVDAMVADVSGVVTDFMQSLKPYAMVAMGMSTEQFRKEFPSSQAAYVIEGDDLSTLEPALDAMLGDDLLASTRADRRRYYLGGFDDDEAARAFVSYAESLARADPAPVSDPVASTAEELSRDLSGARIHEPQT
jgi:CDP-glycerol glycerophosphotransferase (TagB/SpsB family)